MKRAFLQIARLSTRLTLRAALYPYLIRTAPRQKCLGIDVVDLTNEEEDPTPYFAKVTSALEIIARYQPKRPDRIRRDLRYILIFKQPGATYWDDLRACTLSAQSVASKDTEVIALSPNSNNSQDGGWSHIKNLVSHGGAFISNALILRSRTCSAVHHGVSR